MKPLRRIAAAFAACFVGLASTAIGAILAETRTRPQRTGDLAAPLGSEEGHPTFRERPA